MSLYLVTYKLNRRTVNEKKLLSLIKKSNSWARVGECCYLIESFSSPVDFRNSLLPVLQKGDSVFVCEANRPAAWVGFSEQLSDWVMQKM